jgi:hypothetical protein
VTVDIPGMPGVDSKYPILILQNLALDHDHSPRLQLALKAVQPSQYVKLLATYYRTEHLQSLIPSDHFSCSDEFAGSETFAASCPDVTTAWYLRSAFHFEPVMVDVSGCLPGVVFSFMFLAKWFAE